jgi:hypothetical protein
MIKAYYFFMFAVREHPSGSKAGSGFHNFRAFLVVVVCESILFMSFAYAYLPRLDPFALAMLVVVPFVLLNSYLLSPKRAAWREHESSFKQLPRARRSLYIALAWSVVVLSLVVVPVGTKWLSTGSI